MKPLCPFCILLSQRAVTPGERYTLDTAMCHALCTTVKKRGLYTWRKMAPEVWSSLQVSKLVDMNVFHWCFAVWNSHEHYLFIPLAHLLIDACFSYILVLMSLIFDSFVFLIFSSSYYKKCLKCLYLFYPITLSFPLCLLPQNVLWYTSEIFNLIFKNNPLVNLDYVWCRVWVNLIFPKYFLAIIIILFIILLFWHNYWVFMHSWA